MNEHDRIHELSAAISERREVDWDAEVRAAAGREDADLILQLAFIARMTEQNRRGTNGEDIPFSSWGNLRLLSRIGSGSYGDVFRAWDEVLHREVALKLYHGRSDTAEVRGLAQIRHENVVQVHGFDVHQGRSGFWMDLVDGESLAAVLEREHVLDPKRAVEIGIAVCRALAAAHAAGVLHGDIKPSNVLCAGDGRICLVDFGAGRAAAARGVHRVGTPLFMAPETSSYGELTERSDIYSLGALLFHALTGRAPVEVDTLDDLRKAHEERAASHDRASDPRFPDLSALRPDLPSRLRKAIERCLASDPAARYAHAIDLELLLAPLAAGSAGWLVQIRFAIGALIRSPALMASMLLVALALGGIMTALWRQSVNAREAAVLALRRADASRLLTKAQATEDEAAALAYTIASLEEHDSPEARQHAVRLLQHAPTQFHVSHLPDHWNPWAVEFSPDSQWLAIGWSRGGRAQLHPLPNGAPIDLQCDTGWIKFSVFDAASKRLALATDGALALYAVPEGRLVRKIPSPGVPWPAFDRRFNAFLVAETVLGARPRWRRISTDGEPLQDLGITGPTVTQQYNPLAYDSQGGRIASWSGATLFIQPLDASGFGLRRRLGSHPRPILLARFSPSGDHIASVDDSSGVRIWSSGGNVRTRRILGRTGPRPTDIAFDHSERYLAVSSLDGLHLWDLRAPSWMPPLRLEVADRWVFVPAFHPSGRWILASAHGQRVVAWPLTRSYRLPMDGVIVAAFSPDGRWLATGSKAGDIELRPLDAGAQPDTVHHMLSLPGLGIQQLRFDPAGSTLYASGLTLVGDASGGPAEQGLIAAIDMDTREITTWRDPPAHNVVCIDSSSRWVAASGGELRGSYTVVIDAHSGKNQTVVVPGAFDTFPVGFTDTGHLILGTSTNEIYAWHPLSDAFKRIGSTNEIHGGSPGRFLWKDAEDRYRFGDPFVPASPFLESPPSVTPTRVEIVANTAVLGFADGSVEVRDLAHTSEPHLLLAHENSIYSLAIDPFGRWIVSSDYFATYLWPIPAGAPIQNLPHAELLATLHSLTNLRVDKGPSLPNAQSLVALEFPGWEPVRW